MRHAPIKPDLSLIRAAVVTRINEAMVQAQRLASPDVSMPDSLFAACCWLADKAEFEPCEGELYFGNTPQWCLRFLYRLSPEARAEELARGERVLFEGTSRRAPLIDTSLTEASGDPLRRAA